MTPFEPQRQPTVGGTCAVGQRTFGTAVGADAPLAPMVMARIPFRANSGMTASVIPGTSLCDITVVLFRPNRASNANAAERLLTNSDSSNSSGSALNGNALRRRRCQRRGCQCHSFLGFGRAYCHVISPRRMACSTIVCMSRDGHSSPPGTSFADAQSKYIGRSHDPPNHPVHLDLTRRATTEGGHRPSIV